MAFDGVTVTVLLIILVSTLIRAVFGFGNALIAMPLLAMTPIGMKTATPLIALIATILALVILVKDWRIIDLRSTWRLLAATIPGIPLGLILLKVPYENTGKIILALIVAEIILVAIGAGVSLRTRRPPAAANVFGKSKMVLQSIALIIFLVAGFLSLKGLQDFSSYLLWVAVAFAVLSGVKQLRDAFFKHPAA